MKYAILWFSSFSGYGGNFLMLEAINIKNGHTKILLNNFIASVIVIKYALISSIARRNKKGRCSIQRGHKLA